LAPEQVEQRVEQTVEMAQQAQELRRMVELKQQAQEGQWDIAPPPVDSLPHVEYKEWLQEQGSQCDQRMYE